MHLQAVPARWAWMPLLTVLLVTLEVEVKVKNQILLSFRALVMINLAMRFYVLVLPRAIALAIRWQRYRAHGGGHHATALMVFERIVQLLVYGLAALVMLSLDPVAGEAARTSFFSLAAIVLLSFVAVLVFVGRGPAGDERLELGLDLL